MYVYVKVSENATKPKFFKVLSSQKPRFATTIEGFQAYLHYYIHLTASYLICLPKCYNCTDEFQQVRLPKFSKLFQKLMIIVNYLINVHSTIFVS